VEALLEAEKAYDEACELYISTAELEERLKRELMAARKMAKNAKKQVVDCLCDLAEYKKYQDKMDRIGE